MAFCGCVFVSNRVAVTLTEPPASPADLVGLLGPMVPLGCLCVDCLSPPSGPMTYEVWAAVESSCGPGLPANASGPADDPDQDGLPNFAEYACATNPLQPDSELAAPKAGVVRLDGKDYLTITYRRQKTDPVDVQYRVVASDAVMPWAGEHTVTAVGALVDHGTHAEATFRSTQPIPVTAAATGFLRLEIAR